MAQKKNQQLEDLLLKMNQAQIEELAKFYNSSHVAEESEEVLHLAKQGDENLQEAPGDSQDAFSQIQW